MALEAVGRFKTTPASQSQPSTSSGGGGLQALSCLLRTLERLHCRVSPLPLRVLPPARSPLIGCSAGGGGLRLLFLHVEMKHRRPSHSDVSPHTTGPSLLNGSTWFHAAVLMLRWCFLFFLFFYCCEVVVLDVVSRARCLSPTSQTLHQRASRGQ